jgi:LPPG:FO 2-phospho-L-lactate transferase
MPAPGGKPGSSLDASSVLALSGGIGGAKLTLGLQGVLAPGALTVIVNTGDDFEHLGLAICPDIDTTLYTLAGIANPELGWGRADETWVCMQELERLGAESWFRLGDRDLAVHIERTRRLAAGDSLDEIVGDLARRFGIASRVLPMSNDRVRTVVDTDEGTLAFQQYFVRRHCEPAIRAIRCDGAAESRPSMRAADLQRADAVIICPSNPYLSIEPILAIPGWRSALEGCEAPVVAVSPLIGGAAVKGPTAKIMRELSIEVSPLAIAHHYRGIIDGFVLDSADEALAAHFDLPLLITNTLMRTIEDKQRLAREVLEFASTLRHRSS